MDKNSDLVYVGSAAVGGTLHEGLVDGMPMNFLKSAVQPACFCTDVSVEDIVLMSELKSVLQISTIEIYFLIYIETMNIKFKSYYLC